MQEFLVKVKMTLGFQYFGIFNISSTDNRKRRFSFKYNFHYIYETFVVLTPNSFILIKESVDKLLELLYRLFIWVFIFFTNMWYVRNFDCFFSSKDFPLFIIIIFFLLLGLYCVIYEQEVKKHNIFVHFWNVFSFGLCFLTKSCFTCLKNK